jgi:hypothetical protein
MNLCRLADRQVLNRSLSRVLVFSLQDDAGNRASLLGNVVLFLSALLAKLQRLHELNSCNCVIHVPL